MDAHIDWYSFTMVYNHGDNERVTAAFVQNHLPFIVGDDLCNLMRFDTTVWEKTAGRPPFAFALRANGIAIYAGKPSLILIEVSGQGCDYLRRLGNLEKIILKTAATTTRIDVACDIITEINPQAFVARSKSRRARAKSYIKSDTGVTAYVGSRKSERYARVYRYTEPHPRANTLRVEMVSRKDTGKAVARLYCDKGLEAVLKHLTFTYGWEHPLWQTEAIEQNVKRHRADRPTSKTMMWLIKQAAPAFKKLVADGTIEDAGKFLGEYFL